MFRSTSPLPFSAPCCFVGTTLPRSGPGGVGSGGQASGAEGSRAGKDRDKDTVRGKSATTGNAHVAAAVDGIGSLRLASARPPAKNQTTMPLSPTSQLGTLVFDIGFGLGRFFS